ncbi:hypothetical protein N9B82_01775 [Saprospiraceae bacterium]|nr:hypothetical protein [Saprospiraceae bacterium]
MQKITTSFILFCVAIFSFTSCLSDECTDQRSYVRYDPVYTTADQFRTNTIETESLKSLENPGKIYYYNDYLLINQQGEGIHFYDNSDKANPQFVVFYKILGNYDMAIKDDLLVADNVIDMITINISDIMNPVIIDRKEDYRSRWSWATDNPDYQYVAYRVPSPVKEVLDCSDSNFGRNQFWRGDVFLAEANFDASTGTTQSSGGSGSTGIGGSSARFTIVDNYLYAVDNNSLLAYSFESNSAPELENTSSLGWGIETIFPYEDNLFIGSNSGMHIFSLANPAAPSRLSTFQHARACDPVVVEGDLAYVTLRDGNFCQGFANQLDVIDISDLTDPTLIKSHNMKNPHGLSIDGEKLYLSEGSFGMKVLDVSDSKDVKEISWDSSIDSRDLIYLGNNHLMSIGETGFYQYDVTDPKNIIELSHIPTK